MKIVAFVPIKLESQRLKSKNILPLGGKPLSSFIVDTLLSINRIDNIYIYCSNIKIMDYIDPRVIFLKRSPDLDGDLVKGEQIYEAFIKEVDADIYILAHTTSPFLSINSITEALTKVENEQYDSAFSVRKFKTFAWFQSKTLNYELNNIPRTQDIDPIYIETSGFYIFKKSVWTKYKQRIGYNPWLQEVDAIEAIDIDEKEDYDFAKIINSYLEEKKCLH